MGLLKLIMGLMLFLIPIAYGIFWIFMIIEIATKEPPDGNEKIVWLLISIFIPFGAVLYFFIRRPQRINTFGR